jgi:F-type H+-transporting ATPase subunit gamma
MAGQLREYRGRIKSTQSMQKIFRAMELIATSRITKARAAVTASTPYSRALTRAVSAVATFTDAEHPLITERPNPRRAAVLVVTSDRGMAGAYSASAIKEAERLVARLREQGTEAVLFTVGRKAEAFYRFRRREVARTWSGSSESPTYEIASAIGQTLVEAFLDGIDEDGSRADAQRDVRQEEAPEVVGERYSGPGVDEIHIVFTRFVSMVTQEPTDLRLLPLEVVEGVEAPTGDEVLPLYDFEPDVEQVLDALLPRYVSARIYNALLQAAASEHAARQRAMKSAGDNADDLIRQFTRLANQARQAEITQEISEIVSGADALAGANR